MQLNLEEGDAYHMRLVAEQEVTQTFEGMEQTTEQTMGFGFSFTTTEVDEEGNAWVDVAYDWVMMEQQGPMGEWMYDSTDPTADVPPAAMGVSFLVGRGLSIKFTPAGDIEEIEGFEQLMDGILQELGITDEQALEQARQLMREQFNEDTLREQVGNVTIDYPEGAIRIGDQWTSTVASGGQMPLTMESTYTLQAFEEGIATVGMTSTLATDPDAEMADLGFYQMGYALSGGQDAVIEVDIETGWSLGSTITQTLSGEVILVVGEEETTMPMSIDSVISLELVEESG
jgi:hypothetical protein